MFDIIHEPVVQCIRNTKISCKVSVLEELTVFRNKTSTFKPKRQRSSKWQSSKKRRKDLCPLWRQKGLEEIFIKWTMFESGEGEMGWEVSTVSREELALLDMYCPSVVCMDYRIVTLDFDTVKFGLVSIPTKENN